MIYSIKEIKHFNLKKDMNLEEDNFDVLHDTNQSDNYAKSHTNDISDLNQQNSDYLENFLNNFTYNYQDSKISEIIDSKRNLNNEQIFFIINTKREKQKHNYPNDPKERLHTFKSHDNMIKTIKINFVNFLLKLSNDFISNRTKNQKKILINILRDFKTDVSIKLNLLLKDFTIKELFSLPIAKKYVKYQNDYNIKLIKELSETDYEFIKFFNNKISYMILLYSDKNKKNILLKQFKMKTAIPLYDFVQINKKLKKKKSEFKREIIELGKDFFGYFENKKERISQIPKKLFYYINCILNERKKNI